MLDLLEMTPDCARDDGTGLPHRLSHSQAEPLLQALLDHDRGQALDRVDHRVVLVGGAEREAGEMNPRARRGRQSPPAFADLSEHGCCFGVIGDLARVGACEQEVRVARRQHPVEEAVHDPQRVLDAVPSSQRHDDRGPAPVRRTFRVQDRGTSGERSCRPIRAAHSSEGRWTDRRRDQGLQDRAGGGI